MALKERLTKKSEAKAWYGDMPVESLYTVGIAGEKFFRAIKDDGVFLGTKCKTCGLVYVPPKIYCEKCFEKLEDYVEVAECGSLESFTCVHIGLDGKRLDEPVFVGLIRLDGASTCLVHKLGETTVEELCMGMRVCAVLKPKAKREGSINDILYFKPTKE
jgi:uncharacterized OB-fold protein